MKKVLTKLLLMITIGVLSLTTIAFPLKASASQANLVSENLPVKIIKQTDDELIYELEEEGVVLIYEEKIKENKNKTKIETKIYKIVDGKKKLIDNSKKEIIKSESHIEFIKDGRSEIFDLDELRNNEMSSSQVIAPLAYSSWVKTRVPGFNLGYRRDLAANYGDVSYSTMTKTKVKLNNKYFDTFKTKIDNMRSRESSFIYESTAVSAIAYAIKKGASSWSLADIVTLLRKLAVPVNIVWNVGYWIWDYNGATKAWSSIPGTIRYGCNWSC